MHFNLQFCLVQNGFQMGNDSPPHLSPNLHIQMPKRKSRSEMGLLITLQIVLMIIIIHMVITAIFLSPPFIPIPGRRRRSLEGLSSSLKVIPNSDKFKDTLPQIYRVVLGLVTHFMEGDSRISEVGFDTPLSANEISYNRDAHSSSVDSNSF